MGCLVVVIKKINFKFSVIILMFPQVQNMNLKEKGQIKTLTHTSDQRRYAWSRYAGLDQAYPVQALSLPERSAHRPFVVLWRVMDARTPKRLADLVVKKRIIGIAVPGLVPAAPSRSMRGPGVWSWPCRAENLK